MNAGDSFFALRDFTKGKIDRWELMDSDPLISSVGYNKDNRAQNEIRLQFQSEREFLETLGCHDDDVWAAQAVNGYSNYEITDLYSIQEDLLNGYGLWNELNDDNTETLNRISKLLGKTPFDSMDAEEMGDLGEDLFKLFKDEMQSLCSDYAYEKNNEITKSAAEHINSEIETGVKNFGFELFGMDGIKTTVANLISLYIQYNVPHVSLEQLLKIVFDGNQIGGWGDNMWEYQDDKYFDRETFNRDADRIFTKILDKLEEGEDMEPYIKMVDRITKKFKINREYPLPKNEDFKFKINGFDREGRKLDVTLRGPNYNRRFRISEDGFNKLLYNLELFDLAN